MKKNLNLLNRFLGYGNPDLARIFFFGIEEGLPFEGEEDFNKWLRNLKEFEILPNKYLCCDFNGNIVSKTRPVKWPTEGFQAYFSYKILNEVLFEKDLPSLNDYLSKHYIQYEKRVFCSNVFPIGSKRDKDWETPNISITGYSMREKNLYRDDCWNATGRHNNIIARSIVIRDFLKYIKMRMDSDIGVWIFVMGKVPITKMFPILSDIFGIDKNLMENGGCFKNHEKKPVYCSYNKRIWFTQHPSYGHFVQNDVIRVIDYIKHY